MSDPLLSITVPGIPVPQGSMKAFHRPGMRFAVVTSDNVKLKPWRATVALAAAEKVKTLTDRAVTVEIVFRMPRPKSLPKNVQHHTKKPDIDKLVRGIFDALTGVVFADDSQVVAHRAAKRYCVANEQPCAEITVYEAEAVGLVAMEV